MASSLDESEYEIDETITTLMLTGMMPELGMGEKSDEGGRIHVRSVNEKSQFQDFDARFTMYYFPRTVCSMKVVLKEDSEYPVILSVIFPALSQALLHLVV